MRQALVSPIYPLMVLLVCTAVWGYYSNVCITQDWLNAAEAGSALDSARVHQRVGLQVRWCSPHDSQCCSSICLMQLVGAVLRCV